MSIGGGSNKQKSSSSSSSTDYGSDVWGAQSPYLQDIYSQAQSANTLGYNDVWNSGLHFINAGQQADQASGALDRSNAALGTQSDALKQFLNPGEDPAAAAYARNMGQQFNEQFLPGLEGDAAVAGGLGGSRQQIGAALGSQRAMQSIGDFTANIYSGQQDRALQAAMGYGDIASGYQTNAGGRMALGEQRLGLSDFARGMPWYNLNQYAGLLGSPVMKDLGGTSTGTGSGSGSGWNANAGLS